MESTRGPACRALHWPRFPRCSAPSCEHLQMQTPARRFPGDQFELVYGVDKEATIETASDNNAGSQIGPPLGRKREPSFVVDGVLMRAKKHECGLPHKGDNLTGKS